MHLLSGPIPDELRSKPVSAPGDKVEIVDRNEGGARWKPAGAGALMSAIFEGQRVEKVLSQRNRLRDSILIDLGLILGHFDEIGIGDELVITRVRDEKESLVVYIVECDKTMVFDAVVTSAEIKYGVCDTRDPRWAITVKYVADELRQNLTTEQTV
jgi:bifunctional DNA-binding transcriptional regulator/antitoxin component of YhaV-PrlF toxin-antitoxin module